MWEADANEEETRMAKSQSHQLREPQAAAIPPRKRGPRTDGEQAARARILASTSELRVFEPSLIRQLIKERQQRGIDKDDEVWDGVYVMPPLANNPHQGLVVDLTFILYQVITQEGRGQVLPGANVSDRRRHWDRNFRGPDVVVVLNGSRAVDCVTHWMGGPDFLIEVQSPHDDTDEKIPFYSAVQVSELLIIHRDTRVLRLYRHDGQQLVLVEPVDLQGEQCLASTVVPLAVRRTRHRRRWRTEVLRTEGTPGRWTV
jgi:Uma2 family endonuclease